MSERKTHIFFDGFPYPGPFSRIKEFSSMKHIFSLTSMPLISSLLSRSSGLKVGSSRSLRDNFLFVSVLGDRCS